jgi:hypothetical protein
MEPEGHVMTETNTSEPLHKILEAMSLIYEVCLKKEEYELLQGSDFYKQLIKSYNSLQILRDDSLFLPIETDINSGFLREQKNKRVDELTKPPFGAVKESWMK